MISRPVFEEPPTTLSQYSPLCVDDTKHKKKQSVCHLVTANADADAGAATASAASAAKRSTAAACKTICQNIFM